MIFQYILLIDDEMSVNYFHEYLIEDMNLTSKILKARNAEEGKQQLLKLEKAAEIRPSLIFLDINMPRYNGFEFIDMNAELLQELTDRGVYILILTTSTNYRDIEQAQRYDLISSYEQKPMTFEMLKRIVREFGED
ncbi:MAG: response regulator [Bacteroidota bacterium]